MPLAGQVIFSRFYPIYPLFFVLAVMFKVKEISPGSDGDSGAASFLTPLIANIGSVHFAFYC